MNPSAMELRDRLEATLGSRYAIERELGGGGMSRIFVARERALDRQVVIKVLPADLAQEVSTERFRREIMVVAQLQHPNIVGVFTAGDVSGLPYFVMPFVDGESLRHRLHRDARLSVPEAVSILRDVARGLAYAHQQGIVHRDIKPDNVLLAHGVATITDFGVAKALSSAQATPQTGSADTLTRVGTSIGTPAYMAPEQAVADVNVDHRADLYALGVMAYEMLTGSPPFSGQSVQQLMTAHLTASPVPIARKRDDIPAALQSVVMRCLAKEPERRPASATELMRLLEDPAMVSGPVAVPTTAVPAARGSRRTFLAGVGMLVGAAVLALFLFRGGTTEVVAADRSSIAVLPFVNIGADSADDYFADGLTDQLAGALARVPGLRVASRTSAVAAIRSGAAIPEIGERLRVATVLEGTVQRDGVRLRLIVRLVDAADGLSIWSGIYEEEATDVFAVQDSLAVAILDAIKQEFGGELAATEATGTGTSNLEAYDLYLRGRYLFRRRGEGALHQALDYFRQAAALDPNYARAFTGIADVYALLPLYAAAPVDSVFPLALAAANRAIALDSSLAEAWTSRGSLNAAAWRWADAERDYRRAIALSADYATAHQWYGELLLIQGRTSDAVTQLARATELDPLSPVIAGSYALGLAVAGRIDEAVRLGRRGIELDPGLNSTRFLLSAVYLYGGRIDSAIAELEQAMEIDDRVPVVSGLLGYAYGRAGRAGDARRLQSRLLQSRLAGYASAVSRIQLGLNQPDSALVWLHLAATLHDPIFASEPLGTPIFAPLADRERFRELLRTIGLGGVDR
jgi:TolB-like protein/tetratricopeptide (TPR) repeat protein/tRNA A-37 threonylcarbamoyl transferase component Bud32